MIVRPARRIRGKIRLSGDKSVSHRAAIFSSLADGETKITNFASSRDCASTLACLGSLGVEIEQKGSTVTVRGNGKHGWRKPAGPLDCCNSGTTMRLLSGTLAGQSFDSVLVGDSSLQGRPMKRVIEPLAMMGARIDSIDGRAPLQIFGTGHLNGITYETPVPSAQVKSAVLLAGLFADGNTTVIEKTATRDHSERMLEYLGADISKTSGEKGMHIAISGGSVLKARDLEIPGDVSSAAFFAVAAAILEGSELTIEGVGVNPSRTGALEFLKETGLEIDFGRQAEMNNEPVADISVGSKSADNSAKCPRLDGSRIANLIDEIPVLAVYGTQLENGLEIRGARELRVKESDRISAVVTNLRKMNADVEEFDDGMRIGRSRLRGAEIDSFGDHRIAMAFAVAALIADGETEIHGAECVEISFPGFFDVLSEVCER